MTGREARRAGLEGEPGRFGVFGEPTSRYPSPRPPSRSDHTPCCARRSLAALELITEITIPTSTIARLPVAISQRSCIAGSSSRTTWRIRSVRLPWLLRISSTSLPIPLTSPSRRAGQRESAVPSRGIRSSVRRKRKPSGSASLSITDPDVRGGSETYCRGTYGAHLRPCPNRVKTDYLALSTTALLRSLTTWTESATAMGHGHGTRQRRLEFGVAVGQSHPTGIGLLPDIPKTGIGNPPFRWLDVGDEPGPQAKGSDLDLACHHFPDGRTTPR